MPRERNGFKPKLCAAYYGRTERLEEADEKFYRLCKWYSALLYEVCSFPHSPHL